MFKHVGTRFMVFLIPIVIITMNAMYYYSMNVGKNIILSETEQRVTAEKKEITALMTHDLDLAEELTKDLSYMVQESYHTFPIDTYDSLLSSMIEGEEIFKGAGIWFEPYVYNTSEKYVGPYAYKNRNKIELTDEYENPSYDYINQYYYKQVKEARKTVFTNAYYDEHLAMYLITCSSPILDQDGTFLGCVTADIGLYYLEEIVNNYNKTHKGTLSIVSQEGEYLASSDESLVKEGYQITDSNYESIHNAAATIMNGESGLTHYQKGNTTVNLFYDTVDHWGWKIVFELSEQEMNAPLTRYSLMFQIVVLLTIIALVISLYLLTLRNIIHPLRYLEEEFDRIGEDALTEEQPLNVMKRKDEYGKIGNALWEMKKRLFQSQRALVEAMEEEVASSEEIQAQNEQLIAQESMLTEKTENFLAIVKAIPDIVFVISETGQFLECQGNTSNLYLDRELFIGKYLKDVLPAYIADQGMVMIEAAIRTGELQVFEYELANDAETGFFELRIAKCSGDRVLGLVRNITESHERVQKIEFLSYHDPLTKLFNRGHYEQVLYGISKRSYSFPIGIVISDVNGLKMVNDSFGHEAGDQLLIKYTQALNMSGTGEEIIFRIGGDEFAVVIPSCSEPRLKQYVDEVEKNCSTQFVNGVMLSVSFGYKIIEHENVSVRMVINESEDIMYKNKMYGSENRHNSIIEVIVKSLREKNPREEQHSKRVSELSERMAAALGKSSLEIQKIKQAALLHDIGKIGVPEEILNKPGALTEEEYQIACRHAETGYRILQASSHMMELSEIILHHHERWDGTGYPQGLRGEEIPWKLVLSPSWIPLMP